MHFSVYVKQYLASKKSVSLWDVVIPRAWLADDYIPTLSQGVSK